MARPIPLAPPGTNAVHPSKPGSRTLSILCAPGITSHHVAREVLAESTASVEVPDLLGPPELTLLIGHIDDDVLEPR